VDLFCGVGGFRLGMEALGVRTVYSCDNDKVARKWYATFFGKAPEGCDVRKVDRLPEHDILCAGFPCVAFSRAGQKRGRSDARGQLFDEIVRLLRITPSRVGLLLENVPRIVTAENGEMHKHVLTSLASLGYHVHHRILNAGHHGVPQQRRRCFYVALRSPAPFAWPAPDETSGPVLADVLLRTPKLIRKSDITCAEQPKPGDVRRRYPLPQQAAQRYSRAQQMGYIGRNLQGQRIYHRRGLAPTLETWHPVRVWESSSELRVLQPREFARLMGFPDRLPAPPTEEEANKVYGNSVAVPLVTQLGQAILDITAPPPATAAAAAPPGRAAPPAGSAR
jgi:DNA (cytosine-5)-methyltransferase 1